MAKKLKHNEEQESAIKPVDDSVNYKVIKEFSEQANKAIDLDQLVPFLDKIFNEELEKEKLEKQSYSIAVAFFKFKGITNYKESFFKAVQDEAKKQLQGLK